MHKVNDRLEKYLPRELSFIFERNIAEIMFKHGQNIDNRTNRDKSYFGALIIQRYKIRIKIRMLICIDKKYICTQCQRSNIYKSFCNLFLILSKNELILNLSHRIICGNPPIRLDKFIII